MANERTDRQNSYYDATTATGYSPSTAQLHGGKIATCKSAVDAQPRISTLHAACHHNDAAQNGTGVRLAAAAGRLINVIIVKRPHQWVRRPQRDGRVRQDAADGYDGCSLDHKLWPVERDPRRTVGRERGPQQIGLSTSGDDCRCRRQVVREATKRAMESTVAAQSVTWTRECCIGADPNTGWHEMRAFHTTIATPVPKPRSKKRTDSRV